MIQGRFAQTHLIGQHLHGSAMIPTGIEQIGAARDDLQALIIMRCSCGFRSLFLGPSSGDYFAHFVLVWTLLGIQDPGLHSIATAIRPFARPNGRFLTGYGEPRLRATPGPARVM